MDLHLTPIPGQGNRVRQNGDETTFLTESGDPLFDLNEVGSFIWQQMDGSHTLRDILDIVCHEYEVEPAQAQADLEIFVAQLVEQNLLSLIAADR